jgi:hypothetical protein
MAMQMVMAGDNDEAVALFEDVAGTAAVLAV